MKTLLFALSLVFSLSAFADVCFKASTKPSAQSKLPQVVCVNEAKFETVLPGLPRSPYYQASVDTSAGTLEKEIRFFESQRAPFRVSMVLPVHSVETGSCSYSFNSSVEVIFMIDAEGNVLDDSLSVEGHVDTNNDPCHSNDERNTILYSRI